MPHGPVADREVHSCSASSDRPRVQTQYERAQTLLAENRAIYLRMVNELINEGQLAPQKIREWLGLSQPEVPKDALEPFDAKLREFERRVA